MADNYLGRKMEEYYSKSTQSNSRSGSYASLSKLLLKSISFSEYNSNYIITEEQLTKIISVNTLTPFVRKKQSFRFRPVCQDEAESVLSCITHRKALFPLKETEPNAFVIICSAENEGENTDIDLGISVQSMLLKAAEMGLNGICIDTFDMEAIKRELSLQIEPLFIVAIGKTKSNEASKTGTNSHSHLYDVKKDDLIIK